jgi:hypothetical protein
MSPCVHCRRRSVVAGPDGPLCTACSNYEKEESQGYRLEPSETCIFPDPCTCAECEILNVLWPDEDAP